MCKGLGRWRACRSRFVYNTSSPIQSPWKRPCPQAVSPCRAGRIRCASCASYAKWHNVSRCHAADTHTCPCPHPARNAIPSASGSADQQRAANWADGNSTKRAPATGMDGRRFPTTACQLLRIPTLAPGHIAAGQRGDHGCLGYTPCRAAAGTPRANTSLSLRRKSGRTYANAIRF
jgi:hypothetical protein